MERYKIKIKIKKKNILYKNEKIYINI